MRYIGVLLPALVAVLLDVSAAPTATLWGSRASVAVAMVAVWGAVRPLDDLFLLTLMIGLGLGLLGNEPLGTSLVALTPVALLATTTVAASRPRRLAMAVGLAAVGTPVYVLLHALLLRLFGGQPDFAMASFRLIGVTTVLTVLSAGLLYLPLALVSRGGTDRARSQRGRSTLIGVKPR